MSKSFLLIVEGAKTEKNILSAILERYGFNSVVCEQIELTAECKELIVSKLENTTDTKDNVIIVQGPRNRIRDWLKLFDKQTSEFENFFSGFDEHFAGVFIIYDVDHTSNEELEEMFNKYPDETTGLLLVSSPCIEVISDVDRKEELRAQHLTEYKNQLKKKHRKLYDKSTEQYIIDNFEDLMIKCIKKNVSESGSKNVLMHPEFVISQINKINVRTFIAKDNEPVLYRYFTTVVYVAIGYMLGLTKQSENADDIINFFLQHKKSEEDGS